MKIERIRNKPPGTIEMFAVDHHPNSPMKPFIASEFISNQETPVATSCGERVEIITTTARGEYSIIGYIGNDTTPQRWSSSGYFFNSDNPTLSMRNNLHFTYKNEVVHVYQYRDDPKGRYTFVQGGGKFGGNAHVYTYLGTITGPIVPPEEWK
jgi:hypothetical protein